MYQGVTGRRAFKRGAMLLVAVLAAIPAIAAAAEPPTRSVKIADLDLASPLGRQALDRRLRLAIEQVCSPRGVFALRPAEKKRAQVCRQIALADVQRQLEQHGMSPLLAAGL